MRLFSLFWLVTTMSLSAQTDLSVYRGRNRLLIVLGPGTQDHAFQAQLTSNRAAVAGFKERQLLTFAESDPRGPLHQKFEAAPDVFRAILIGKDGHVAFTRSEPVSASDLFAVIDAMPMRKEEMLQQQSDH